jgi:hypothetical protein
MCRSTPQGADHCLKAVLVAEGEGSEVVIVKLLITVFQAVKTVK